MFSESSGSRKAIGDVDVVYHDGLYHLFHLVLPNHDFIAHAVSTDGINWRRVANALFIADPGSWDDLMLWTMHITPDPYEDGRWRMFYTGLSRRDQGGKQRIGLAVSDDLFHWHKCATRWEDLRGPSDPEKVKEARAISKVIGSDERHAPYDPASCLPITPSPEFYESEMDEGRHWVSFRDPFFYWADETDDGEGGGYLLAAGRVKDGPVVRRGCVAAMKEVLPGHFKALPPLHHPGLYDDIEVPNLIQLGGEYYLIGSIREDAKIRYWHTDKIGNPWRSYQDNVLMARGNYAGRISKDENGYLLWNFFTCDVTDRTNNNLMPPPKRLVQTKDGLLKLASYEVFDQWVEENVNVDCVRRLESCPPHQDDATGEHNSFCVTDDRLELLSDAGFQIFTFGRELACFRFRAHFRLNGRGKCGFVFRMDPESRDGYYLSLDLLKGVAQFRVWDSGEPGSGEHMMKFRSVQTGYWYTETPGEADIQLLCFGSYFELSVNGHVLLSLADQTFSSGAFGLYLETCHLFVSDARLERMRSPMQSDDHLASG